MNHLETALSGSKAVITGGAGFIGSHLMRSMVTHCVSKLTGIDHERYGTWRNVAEISDRPEVTLLTQDLLDVMLVPIRNV